MNVVRSCAGLALLLAGFGFAQELEIRVELTAPLGTDVSRKGDAISARVLEPPTLIGDTVTGKVNESKAGNKLTGKAVLSFSFDTLQHGGEAIPIAAQVKSIANSKGKENVDEEGRVISRSSGNLVKAAAGTGVGALIGGLAGGGKGAAIGAGAGLAASVILIEVVAQGPSVRLAPGSRMLLGAKARDGRDLTALTPNAPPASSPAVTRSVPPPSEPADAAPAQSYPPLAAPPAPPAVQTAGQPDLTAVKADFIPGERVIFYDDFTDMAGDEPPPHWKVRGAAAELMTAPGIRQLNVRSDESFTFAPNLKGLPKNFTMETDLTIPVGNADCRPEMHWDFLDQNDKTVLILRTKQNSEEDWWLRLDAGDDSLGEITPPVNWRQVAKLALWVQNGRVRLYLNGQRLIDVNQVDVPEVKAVQISGWTGVKPVGFRFARFAESSPDFGQAIASSGRYVTHGILFDTDSDRLKPESAAVVKAIAHGLDTNPNLKLRVEGHTDSTGNADHNLDLSRRRAEAVKAVLVGQFGVDASRLTCAGIGATQPIDSNDTPAGRAQNRRVEFVKE